MSRIKWQKARAVLSQAFAIYGCQPDGYPLVMAPKQLASLQYPPTPAGSDDAKAFQNAIESAIKADELPHSICKFEMPIFVFPLFGPMPEPVMSDLPAIAAADFAQWLKTEGEAPSVHIQAWFDAIAPVEVAPRLEAPESKTKPEVMPAQHTMKKAALIDVLRFEWESVDADFQEATRNGLKEAAHAGTHGMWDREKARNWALSKGKIKQDVPAQGLAVMWPGVVTRHKISDP